MKVHLYTVAEPLADFPSECMVNCGKLIRNPKLALVWDETLTGNPLDLRLIANLCRRCRDQEMLGEGLVVHESRYLYGLTPAKETSDETDDSSE